MTARSDDAARTRFALTLWDAAGRVRGSAGEYYLAMRGLSLPSAIDGEVARFHPACPRQGGAAPALVVLLRTIEGDTPVAVQRIFVTKDYRKDGTPMMLGPVKGAAIKLSSHRAACTGALSWFMPRLHVCEGFETGLALLQLGYAPAWALGSAGAIARLPLLWFVGQLVVCADNDVSRTGEAAAAAALATWGWRAHALMVNAVGKDFADLAQQEGL